MAGVGGASQGADVGLMWGSNGPSDSWNPQMITEECSWGFSMGRVLGVTGVSGQGSIGPGRGHYWPDTG